MEIPMLVYVKARLAELRPMDFDVVAQKSGVPIGTIRKVHYGEVDHPRIDTIQRLHDYFRSISAKDGKKTQKAAA